MLTKPVLTLAVTASLALGLAAAPAGADVGPGDGWLPANSTGKGARVLPNPPSELGAKYQLQRACFPLVGENCAARYWSSVEVAGTEITESIFVANAGRINKKFARLAFKASKASFRLLLLDPDINGRLKVKRDKKRKGHKGQRGRYLKLTTTEADDATNPNLGVDYTAIVYGVRGNRIVMLTSQVENQTINGQTGKGTLPPSARVGALKKLAKTMLKRKFRKVPRVRPAIPELD